MNKPVVVVSALLEKINDLGEIQVFVQTRHKKNSPNYSDMLEIPAGKIESYENVYEALKREVFEETGMNVIKVFDEEKSLLMENRPSDISLAFQPYFCQQVLSTRGGLPWYGFVFRCQVEGEIKMQLNEAIEPRWLSLQELKVFLDKYPDKVFSLQYATLYKYLVEQGVSNLSL